MRNFVCALMSALVLVGCGSGHQESGNSENESEIRGIVNGKNSYKKAIVAVLPLNKNGVAINLCTGTLITPSLVLTTSSCFRDIYSFEDRGAWADRHWTSDIVVTNDSKIPTILNNIARSQLFYTPGDAWHWKEDNEIAIIKLKKPYPGITQADLPYWVLRDTKYRITPGQPVTTYGYGLASKQISTVGVQRVATVRGKGNYPATGWGQAGYINFGVRRDYQLQQFVCAGDNGGPLIIPPSGGYTKARIIGVLGWANASDCTATYAEYLNVSMVQNMVDAALSNY